MGWCRRSSWEAVVRGELTCPLGCVVLRGMPETMVAARVLVTGLLPPKGPLRRYALVSLIDSVGTGLFLTVSTLFFTRVVGLSAARVGLGLSLAGLCALAGAVPLGVLGDRLGHRRVWIALTVGEAAVFATYPWIGSFAGFVVAVTLVALMDVGTAPIRGSYLSEIAGPEQRVAAKAYNQAVFNAGFALGALGAGVALQIGTHTAYVSLVLGDAGSYLIAALLLSTLPTSVPARRGTAGIFGVFRDRPFLAICVLNGLLMTDVAVLTVALPLWIVQRTNAPRWAVAAVFLLDTGLAVILQVRASRGADTVPGAARALRRAGVLLLLACVVLSISGTLPAVGAVATLTLGVALFAVGGLLQSAGAWGLSYGLSPPDRQGEYLGAFAMGTRIYDAAGPALVIGLILGLGTAGWLLLGALFLGLSAALTPASNWAARSVR